MEKVIKALGIFVFSLICLLLSVLVLCNIRPADISSKAQELKAYCIDNGYNADYVNSTCLMLLEVQKEKITIPFCKKS